MIAQSQKEKAFSRYAEHLYSKGMNNATIGRRLGYVRTYLNQAHALTDNGYRKFMKDNSVTVSFSKDAISCIRDFMSFITRKHDNEKNEEVQSLELLSKISEDNQRRCNDFAVWLNAENDFSSCTVRSYLTAVLQYYNYAADFNLELVKRFIKTLEEEGRSPKTINLKITALEKYGEYVGSPIKIKRPKITKSLNVENVPTEKEYNVLLEYLKEKNYLHYLWVRVLATTGARVSEFVQFRWEDIFSGEVVLKGKGNKYRRFFFQKQVIEECRIYKGDKTGYFAKNKSNEIVSTRGIAALMKDWAEKCGIDRTKIHPHAFRHFFAKMFIKSNRDIVQLADLLGHGSIETTRIYLQRSYDEQKRDFNRNVKW